MLKALTVSLSSRAPALREYFYCAALTYFIASTSVSVGGLLGHFLGEPLHVLAFSDVHPLTFAIAACFFAAALLVGAGLLTRRSAHPLFADGDDNCFVYYALSNGLVLGAATFALIGALLLFPEHIGGADIPVDYYGHSGKYRHLILYALFLTEQYLKVFLFDFLEMFQISLTPITLETHPARVVVFLYRLLIAATLVTVFVRIFVFRARHRQHAQPI
jgi:hypothetical protein